MSITANVGGALKTLAKVTANVNGALKELNTVHANVNGVLKKIFPSAPFKVLTGTLTSPGGTTETNASLTNVVITQPCTAKIKVHIDTIGNGSDGRVRSVSVTGSATENVSLQMDGIVSNAANTDWYGEIQLSAGTYSFSFAIFNVTVSNKGTSSAKVTYSSSTITYEISFS